MCHAKKLQNHKHSNLGNFFHLLAHNFLRQHLWWCRGLSGWVAGGAWAGGPRGGWVGPSRGLSWCATAARGRAKGGGGNRYVVGTYGKENTVRNAPEITYWLTAMRQMEKMCHAENEIKNPERERQAVIKQGGQCILCINQEWCCSSWVAFSKLHRNVLHAWCCPLRMQLSGYGRPR